MRLTDQVPKENYFYYHNGSVVRDVAELIRAIEAGSDEDFYHHVSEGKNDFSEWIKNVYSDEELAKEVRKAASKQETLEKLEQALSYQLTQNLLEEERKKQAKTFVPFETLEKEERKKERIEVVEGKPQKKAEEVVYQKENPVVETIFIEKNSNYLILGIIVGIIIGMILARLFLT